MLNAHDQRSKTKVKEGIRVFEVMYRILTFLCLARKDSSKVDKRLRFLNICCEFETKKKKISIFGEDDGSVSRVLSVEA